MPYAVAIEIGEVKVRATVFDESRYRAMTPASPTSPLGPVVTRDATPNGAQPAQAVNDLLDLADECLKQANVKTGDVLGIGVALPNPVDLISGRVEETTVRPLIVDPAQIYEMAAGRSNKFPPQMVVRLGNNANMAAQGEFRMGVGRAQLTRNLVYLLVDRGIGGGIVINGSLFSGSGGYAGEIGHVIVDPQGPQCVGCKQRGCLEVMASGVAIAQAAAKLVSTGGAAKGTAIVNQMLQHSNAREYGDLGAATIEPTPFAPTVQRIDAVAVIEAAKQGDAAARSIVTKAGECLGLGITTVLHVLNPDTVVLGGLPLLSDLMKQCASDLVRSRALRPLSDGCRILTSTLKGNATLYGAALLVLDE
jgi:glucokinase